MAKVFRLHEGAAGTGWFVSQPLTPAQLTTIRIPYLEIGRTAMALVLSKHPAARTLVPMELQERGSVRAIS